jgi:hypothetical protein
MIREAEKAAENAIRDMIHADAKKTRQIRYTVAEEINLGSGSDDILCKILNLKS